MSAAIVNDTNTTKRFTLVKTTHASPEGLLKVTQKL